MQSDSLNSRWLDVRIFWHLSRNGCGWGILAGLANLAAVLFEGSSIAFLALGLHVLVGTAPSAESPLFAHSWNWLSSWSGSLGREKLFFVLASLAIGSQMLRSVLQFSASYATAQLQALVQAEAYHRIFQKIVRLPFSRVSAYRLGDLTHLLNQAQYLHEFLSQLNLLIRSCLLAAVYLALLLSLSWRLSLIALVVYALISTLLSRIILHVGRHASSFTQATQSILQQTTEFLQGIREIHTFAREEEAVQRVKRMASEGMSASRAATVWGSLVEPAIDLLMLLGAAVFLVGGYLWSGSRAQQILPSLLAFLVAVHRMTPRLGAVHTSLAAIAGLLPHLKQVIQFLSESEEEAVSDPTGRWENFRLKDQIEFRNVSLQYRPKESPALRGFSCTLPKGSMVALVGTSGAGKSSIADLLVRLYPPTNGQILIDGTSLEEIPIEAWRNRLGVVSQDPFLFHGTLWENIAFGRRDARSEEILQAARAARVEEFASRLEEGYQTVIGSRGFRLSGGQRQRIALARALIRQPDLLILDEATSALDSESERFIQEALDQQRHIRTILVISHRLSTVTRADQILVLEHGQLTEQGRHAELLRRNSLYARLWRLQSEGEGTASVEAVK